MRHRVVVKKLQREKAPRTALYRSLTKAIILEETVQTTLAKAKAVQPLVEQLITIGKKKNRHAEHMLTRRVNDDATVDKLLTSLADRYADREGGYTRIRKLGYRKGDGAPVAQVSLIRSTTKR